MLRPTRRLDALELNDNIVQALVAARYALDRGDLSTAEEWARAALGAGVTFDPGDPLAARRNIDKALESSRTLITELLPDGPVVPGNARRRDRAGAAGAV